MTKPIVYGTTLSPPVRTVLLTAKAIGLDIEYREISLGNQEHLTEDYVKKNPQHTVPTLDDNGTIVWDSHAIATYLIGKYAKSESLYPKNLHLRARIDQRLHFDSGVLFSVLRDIVAGLLYHKKTEIDEWSIKKVNDGYGFLEEFLANDTYMVGNSLTVADLSCVATTTTLNLFIPIDTAKYPKVIQWIQRLSKLPYYATNQNGIDQFEEVLKLKWKRGE